MSAAEVCPPSGRETGRRTDAARSDVRSLAAPRGPTRRPSGRSGPGVEAEVWERRCIPCSPGSGGGDGGTPAASSIPSGATDGVAETTILSGAVSSSLSSLSSSSSSFGRRKERQALSCHRDVIGRNRRSEIGIRPSSSLSSSPRSDAAVEVVEGAIGDDEREDDDRPLDLQRWSGVPTTKKVEEGEQRDRIPVLSYMNNYVIVFKPCGMTMHHNLNAHLRWGMSKSPVLQTAIRRQLSRKPYLVHRLDHRTSGAWEGSRSRRMPSRTSISLSSMSADDNDDVDVDVDDDAPEDGTISTTARIHQIRRHLQKALMSPIIGDMEHGDSRVNLLAEHFPEPLDEEATSHRETKDDFDRAVAFFIKKTLNNEKPRDLQYIYMQPGGDYRLTKDLVTPPRLHAQRFKEMLRWYYMSYHKSDREKYVLSGKTLKDATFETQKKGDGSLERQEASAADFASLPTIVAPITRDASSRAATIGDATTSNAAETADVTTTIATTTIVTIRAGRRNDTATTIDRIAEGTAAIATISPAAGGRRQRVGRKARQAYYAHDTRRPASDGPSDDEHRTEAASGDDDEWSRGSQDSRRSYSSRDDGEDNYAVDFLAPRKRAKPNPSARKKRDYIAASDDSGGSSTSGSNKKDVLSLAGRRKSPPRQRFPPRQRSPSSPPPSPRETPPLRRSPRRPPPPDHDEENDGRSPPLLPPPLLLIMMRE
ncbi:hypothetical protein ACHAW5_006392 [Stephanodiscus triporus]|uniref:Pseudouridine synthase RsuA/RluA-like domain-containing protein n=1 Tax=Stephanodiscus triporus TaxID=2934178 RepID=A0ABD3QTP8_9STRA